MDKQFKVGMYGGKFLPFHKGHLMCMQKAAEMCEILYLILFVGGSQENEVIRNLNTDEDNTYLSVEDRQKHINGIVKDYPNVKFITIDVGSTLNEDGSENWDAETPLVLAACGQLDAVFGSEPSYADYFNRAYPTAKYVMIDPERRECPISGTAVRGMDIDERQHWIA